MSRKYFAYLNWKMMNDDKKFAIVPYEDMKQLITGKGRYSDQDIKSLFTNASESFGFGAILIESSGHHHLVVSHKAISLEKVIMSSYFCEIYSEYYQQVKKDPGIEKLRGIIDSYRKKESNPFRFPRYHSLNFYELRHFNVAV